MRRFVTLALALCVALLAIAIAPQGVSATSAPTLSPTSPTQAPINALIAGEAYQSVDKFTPFVWEYVCLGTWAFMLFRVAYNRSSPRYNAVFIERIFNATPRTAEIAFGALWNLFALFYLWALIMFFTYEEQWLYGVTEIRHNAMGIAFLAWPLGQIILHETILTPFAYDVPLWLSRGTGHVLSFGSGVTAIVVASLIFADNTGDKDDNLTGTYFAMFYGGFICLHWLMSAWTLWPYGFAIVAPGVGVAVPGVVGEGGRGSAKVRSGDKGLGNYTQTDDDETGVPRKKGGSRRALEADSERYGY